MMENSIFLLELICGPSLWHPAAEFIHPFIYVSTKYARPCAMEGHWSGSGTTLNSGLLTKLRSSFPVPQVGPATITQNPQTSSPTHAPSQTLPHLPSLFLAQPETVGSPSSFPGLPVPIGHCTLLPSLVALPLLGPINPKRVGFHVSL